MCSTVVASAIFEFIQNSQKHQSVFTAFDVTMAVRATQSETIPHKEVRAILNNEFLSGNLPDYNRELCSLDLPNSPQAWVYFPDGKQASDHYLVSSINIIEEDDIEEEEEETVDDEYEITSEGRVNIPKKLLTKVSASAGSYDILINGSLKSVTPNKDGRVRISLRYLGITNGRVKMTVDTSNNTINLEWRSGLQRKI